MSDQLLIGFAGLSHLGIVYSVAAAARGFSVVAFDSNERLSEDLTAGRFSIQEPGLEKLFRSHQQHLLYTSDPSVLSQCPLIFIALDVETDAAANSDLSSLEALIATVTSHAMEDTVVALLSQVPPGFCRRLAAQLRPDLKLHYQVETLIVGNALKRAVEPERYAVGCADPELPLPCAYLSFLRAFGCPILLMRYESAELCKIAINCLLASSVCVSNTLAELCEGIQADWSEVMPALRLDRRIGLSAYLNPGLGIAGGNLERDLVTVQRFAAEYGSDCRVITTLQQHSAYMRDWVLRQLFRLGLLTAPAETLFAMWGLAYKPDTDSTKNSPSLAVLRSLAGYSWSVHDPLAKIACSEFPEVRICETALAAVRDASVLIVMTHSTGFSQLPLEDVRDNMRGRQILDPCATLDQRRCLELGFKYHRLGAPAC
jgi:UDPglucose 6-dehydrogenase